MKKIISILLFFAFFTISFSQNRIYFDKDWKVTSQQKMFYYRETSKEGNLIKIKDFYKNGKLQMEGLASDASFENEIFEGEVKWYYPDGKIQSIKNFEKGREVGLQEDFDEKGRIIERRLVKDNEDHSTQKYYYKDSLKIVNIVEIWDKQYKKIYYDEDVNGIRTEQDARGNYKFYDEKGMLIGDLNVTGDEKSGTEVNYFYNPMKVMSVTKYEKNKIISIVNYFPNKEVESKLTMKGDSGIYEKYDKNGKLLSTIETRRDGDEIAYFKGKFISEKFLDESGSKSYIAYVYECKDGKAVNQKYYSKDGKLIKEKTLEKSVNYNDNGTIKYTMIYKDGEIFDGTEENENSVFSFKEGKLISYIVFNPDTKQHTTEIELDEKTGLYVEKIFGENSRLKYILNEKDTDSFDGEIKVETYENGKQTASGILIDGTLESGKIIFSEENKKITYTRNNENIDITVVDSDGKILSSETYNKSERTYSNPKIIKEYFYGESVTFPGVVHTVEVQPPPPPSKK